MADERDVGGADDPHEPRRRTGTSDPVDDRLEHVRVEQAVDRRAEGVAEGRDPAATTTSSDDPPLRAGPSADNDRFRRRSTAEQTRVDGVRQPS